MCQGPASVDDVFGARDFAGDPGVEAGGRIQGAGGRPYIRDNHGTRTGIDAVYVNGVAVWRDGQPTGRRPGVVLRRAEGAD